MNILYIVDKDSKTELSEDLRAKIKKIINDNGHKIEIVEVGKNDVLPCAGCLYCFTKSNGICARKDLMVDINKKIKDSDIIFYITPVIFGQFSSTIKNTVDKSQLLKKGRIPFLITIGYGDDVNNEEKATFMDITKKHRGDANIVHPLMKERFDVFVSRSLKDNEEIYEELRNII